MITYLAVIRLDPRRTCRRCSFTLLNVVSAKNPSMAVEPLLQLWLLSSCMVIVNNPNNILRRRRRPIQMFCRKFLLVFSSQVYPQTSFSFSLDSISLCFYLSCRSNGLEEVQEYLRLTRMAGSTTILTSKTPSLKRVVGWPAVSEIRVAEFKRCAACHLVRFHLSLKTLQVVALVV